MNIKFLSTLYFLSWSAASYVAFSGTQFMGVGYLAIIATFIIPAFLIYSDQPHQILSALFVACTAVLILLITIDPVEHGLFGHDPYIFTLPSLELYRSGDAYTALNGFGSWPHFYFEFLSLSQVLGINDTHLGKYIPLALLIPTTLLFFVAVRRLTESWRLALVSALAIPATRTFSLVNAKFVDETIAYALLFTLLVLCAILRQSNTQSLASKKRILIPLSLAAIALLLSHPSVSLAALILLFFWQLTGNYDISRLSQRFHTKGGLGIGVPLFGALLIIYTVIWVWVATDFFRPIFATIYDSLLGNTLESKSTTGSLESGGEETLRERISFLSIAVIGLLSALGMFAVLSNYKDRAWQTAWIIYSGIILLLYGISLFAGRVVPLDPGRYLLLVLPLLFASTIFMLQDLDLSTPSIRTVVLVIFSGLVVTQMAGLPPHVVYTDQSSTSLLEGHYTTEQFGASSWAGIHSNGGVSGYESGLWVSRGSQFHDIRTSCAGLGVIRLSADNPDPDRLNIIYSSGNVSLYDCQYRFNST